MAYFEKRSNGKWRAEVCIDRQRRSKTFLTKREAVAWANEQEEDGILARHTLMEAIDKYRPIAESHKGAQSELSRLKTLKKMDCVNMQIAHVTSAHIAAYREKRVEQGLAPTSVRRELIVLASIFREAAGEWGWIRSSPMSEVKMPIRPKARMRGISQQEIDDILPVLKQARNGPQVACMFELSLETAARLGELIGLEWGDVKEKSMLLRETKNSDSRMVPLSTKARELISSRRGVGMDPTSVFTISRDAASKAFQRARTDAGHPTVHFHDARGEAITRLSKKLDVLQLAKAVGHRDLKSLMMYYAETADQIADQLG